jgi:CheY-like chemotaxis protein
VQQILFNLVLNARDAISDSGRITVETANCDLQPPDTAVPRSAMPGVLLAVSDTGCGMTAETRSHLFEPFFTTKTPGRGNGLGLANVYNIVKNSGGSIAVESEPGQGARFSVILPRIPEAPIAGKVELRHSPARAGETVLLVEDNVTVRAAAKRVLSECGYQVLEAGNGAEAIVSARRHPETIHLLLADVVMPGMSGRELGRQLHRERPALKVLYMSGYEPQQSDEEEDPVVFVRKPFTGAALLDKVREILETNSPPGLAKSGKRKREQS